MAKFLQVNELAINLDLVREMHVSDRTGTDVVIIFTDGHETVFYGAEADAVRSWLWNKADVYKV